MFHSFKECSSLVEYDYNSCFKVWNNSNICIIVELMSSIVFSFKRWVFTRSETKKCESITHFVFVRDLKLVFGSDNHGVLWRSTWHGNFSLCGPQSNIIKPWQFISIDKMEIFLKRVVLLYCLGSHGFKKTELKMCP